MNEPISLGITLKICKTCIYNRVAHLRWLWILSSHWQNINIPVRNGNFTAVDEQEFAMSLVAPGYENYLELGDTLHCLGSIFFKVFIEFVMFWFCGLEACEILAPWPGIEPTPPYVKKWSFNYWTAREVSRIHFLKYIESDLLKTKALCFNTATWGLRSVPSWYLFLLPFARTAHSQEPPPPSQL